LREFYASIVESYSNVHPLVCVDTNRDHLAPPELNELHAQGPTSLSRVSEDRLL